MSATDSGPRDTLSVIDSLRARTRAVRPRTSIPLLLVGLLMLGAMPFYLQRSPDNPDRWSPSRLSALSGNTDLTSATSATLYWVIGVPACFVAVVAYFAWRARRTGVQLQTRSWTVAGISVCAITLLAVYLPGLLQVTGSLFGRGLLPLVTISATVVIWGLVSRLTAVLIVGAIGIIASLIANLYNVENLLPSDLVDQRYRLVVNIALPGAVFVLGSIATAVRERSVR